ncbi:NADH-dependent gamma-hydroxybutyrate dehydrogenase [Budvicia aquatica]|uniref:NADH-dependent gamma-hydroxybutyrate dehydrogenase n=1 Tax=Budvicia aquatica TaxID=82979 RepID=A0A484ZPX4_9GAMM|nr:NADH-dependent gamma-hydroxybutyrate dehydrogenase [Budvicia aquatica]
MGIRVKLINNYMSIALNALSAEAAVLCEALGLPFDVALQVMSGTPAGKGHFTTSWPNKVLKGDLSPAFMIDLATQRFGDCTRRSQSAPRSDAARCCLSGGLQPGSRRRSG